MEEQNKSEYIDLREVVLKIWRHKKFFFKVWVVTFILSCAWILPIPRAYDAEVMLAPEPTEGQMSGGMLGSLASSFGVNIGSMVSGNDALYPILYPDLIKSNDFMVSLFDIPVTDIDNTFTTDYYTYLTKKQTVAFYLWPKIWLKMLSKKLFPPKTYDTGSGGKVNPFRLSKEQSELVKAMQEIIYCSVDRKTDVVTIRVIDQDPLICATIADSVRVRLQRFITDYRTSKARIDKEHYEELAATAKLEYEEATARYGQFCDTHRDVILQSMMSERDALENDMQMKYQTYQVMCTQLEAAKAKVQERTPAFTILQGASVPVNASKPQRMLFVIFMLILSTIGTFLYLFRDDFMSLLTPGNHFSTN